MAWRSEGVASKQDHAGDYSLSVALTIISLWIILMIRVFVTLRIKINALDVAFLLGRIAIQNYDMKFMRYIEHLESQTFDQLLFNPLVWTAKQAYPLLYKEAYGQL